MNPSVGAGGGPLPSVVLDEIDSMEGVLWGM